METKLTTERDRIEQLMMSEGLNAVQFAAETGIKSATISHILNGRNNPSLDVLKRIVDRYRNISSDWLFLGVGPMYRQKSQPQTLSLFENQTENVEIPDSYVDKNIEKNVSEKISVQEKKDEQLEKSDTPLIIPPQISKSVHKIIVYYSDNTFEEFLPK